MNRSIRWRVTICFCFLAFFAYYLASGTSGTSAVSVAVRPSDDQPCSAVPTGWLPNTPPTPFQNQPPSHAQGGGDCPFYQAAWQTFLFATQPDSGGRPRFLSQEYSTIEELFGSSVAVQFAKKKHGLLGLAPRTIEAPNDKSTPPTTPSPSGIGAGVSQAGFKSVLIDQNGNPIYYAIHVNDVYRSFIKANGLTTKDALLNAPDSLKFPTGSVELKPAWQIVDYKNPPPNYFTIKALVPKLHVQNGVLVATKASRQVTVALIALHVVFVLEKHPEFIWSTFEHVSKDGKVRDNAPAADKNPDDLDPDTTIATTSWTLFKAGTKAKDANAAHSDQELSSNFDEKTQRFNAEMGTSVYRAFPASKSPVSSPKLDEDSDIKDVNLGMVNLFGTAPPGPFEKRGNYQLVGAVWLDDPDNTFALNKEFKNRNDQDSDHGMVAGEDRLSSTAMESFTQTSFPNCFSCHNTSQVTDDPGSTVLVKPKLLNVSHVMSKFVADSK